MRRRRRASLLQVEKTSLPAKRSLISRRSSMRLDASGGGSEGSFSSPTRTRHQTIELMREVQSGQKNQLLPSRMTMDVAASQLAQEMAPSYSRAFNNHSCCYRMLNGRSKSTQGRVFKFVVLVLIVVSCMNFLASTIPGIDDDPIWAEVIFAVEAVSSVFFLVEYILRMSVVPSEKRNLRGLGCLGGRLRFALTFDMLIDLISFLPFFIECAAKLCDQAFPMSKLTEKLSDLPQFGWLRATRIFRLFKVEKYTSAFRSVLNVLYVNRHMVGVLLLINAVLILVLASVLFFLAPPESPTADFASLPATMYLAVLMLTGQGVPEGELPWYTKIIVAITSLISTALFVLPASILTWGFEAEAERNIRKQIVGRQRELVKEDHQRSRAAAEKRRAVAAASLLAANSGSGASSPSGGLSGALISPETPLMINGAGALCQKNDVARVATVVNGWCDYFRMWVRGGRSSDAVSSTSGTGASDTAPKFRRGDPVVVRHGAGTHWFDATVMEVLVVCRDGDGVQHGSTSFGHRHLSVFRSSASAAENVVAVSYSVRCIHSGSQCELLSASMVRKGVQAVPCGWRVIQALCGVCCSRTREIERSQARSWEHLEEARQKLELRRGAVSEQLRDADALRRAFALAIEASAVATTSTGSGSGSTAASPEGTPPPTYGSTAGTVPDGSLETRAAAHALATLLCNDSRVAPTRLLRAELAQHLTAVGAKQHCEAGSVDFKTFREVADGIASRIGVALVEQEDALGGEAYLDSEPDTSSTESEGSEDYDENEEWANQYEAVILGDDDFWSGQLAGVSEEQALDNFTDKIFDALDKDGDGTITAVELKAYLRKSRNAAQDRSEMQQAQDPGAAAASARATAAASGGAVGTGDDVASRMTAMEATVAAMATQLQEIHGALTREKLTRGAHLLR